MPELIANRRLSYGTRRLQADDRFQATKQDARVLVALCSARYAPNAVQEVHPAPAVDAECGSEQAVVSAPAEAPVRRGRPPKVRG